MKKVVFATILTLLIVDLITQATGVPIVNIVVTGNDELGTYSYQTSFDVTNMELAQTMQTLASNIDWNKAVYAATIFNKKTKEDLEALIDTYNAQNDWLNVLRWTAACRKLGIERETAIKSALDNIPMIGSLPKTIRYGGIDYFCVEDKYALLGYEYAEKYGYRLEKWNKTKAYDHFKNAINNTGRPVLFVEATGKTWTISYGPRYYDESACTIQCFIIFYELGIAEALNEAVRWWDWTNENLWYENTHYKYGLSWTNYECEAGSFAKVAANLRYYVRDLENWSRVSGDLQNRFLIDMWNSKQWFSSSDSKSAYVAVHHYPSNSQRRLGNSLAAWTSLQSIAYWESNDFYKNAMQMMLEGHSDIEPAWRLLMSPIARLFDSNASKFRWMSDSSPCDDATAYALLLMSMMGIVPKTAVLAVPIEEYFYEYIQDIDPNLYNVNLNSNTLRIPIARKGELEFLYGTLPVICSFASTGIYEIEFAADWNSIKTVFKLGELPTDAKFLPDPLLSKHDIAVVNVTLSNQILESGENTTISIEVANMGGCTETFDLVTFANSTIINVTSSVILAGEETRNINFVWNVQSLPLGTYVIKTLAVPVPEETDTRNNVYTAGIVQITGNWVTAFKPSDLPVVDFAVLSGNLYAASGCFIHVYDGSGWTSIEAPTRLWSLEPYGGQLVAGGDGGLYAYNDTGFITQIFQITGNMKVLGAYDGMLYATALSKRLPNLYFCNGSDGDLCDWQIDQDFLKAPEYSSNLMKNIDSFGVYNDVLYVTCGRNVYARGGTDWMLVYKFEDVYACLDVAVYNGKLYLATADQSYVNACYRGCSGFSGEIIEFDGTEWKTVIDLEYRALCLEIHEGELQAGAAGKLYTYDGTAWRVSFDADGFGYYAISLASFDGKVYIGMGNGRILVNM